MNYKQQAEDFYLKDAQDRYRSQHYSAAIGLCRIVLLINPHNQPAATLLEQALTELEKQKKSGEPKANPEP